MNATTKITSALLLAGIITHAADWPNIRGPQHTGKSSETVAAWTAAPREVWKVPSPNGFSSIVVSQGRAFTQYGKDEEGVLRETLVSMDAQSGKELWSQNVGVANYGHGGGNDGVKENKGGDGPRSTPTVDGEQVYVLSADLVLSSWDAATGKQIWSKDVLKEHGGKNVTWKNAASPLIDGDLIFVAGGGSGQALLGINKKDGKTVWKSQDDELTHATPVIATIHGVKQVIFFTKKGLVSLNPATGALIWRQAFPFSVSTAATPVVSDNIVYCSAGYGVGAGAYEVSKNGAEFSSRELWRSQGNKLANHWSTPIVKDGYLYGMFQFKEYGEGPVKCIDIKTGEEKWAQKGFGPGNVTMVGDKLMALTDDGEVVLIDPKPDAFKELARFQAVTGKCWSTPTFANGRVYVRSTKEAACFELGTKLTAK